VGHSPIQKNGPLPPKWANPGGGWGRWGHRPGPAKPAGTTTPRRTNGNPSRTGRYGWGPGNRALSSGKHDGGATMGTYSRRPFGMMTKKSRGRSSAWLLQPKYRQGRSCPAGPKTGRRRHRYGGRGVSFLTGGCRGAVSTPRPQRCGNRPGGRRPGSKAGVPLDPGPPPTLPRRNAVTNAVPWQL
jgi:hypothetical protein